MSATTDRRRRIREDLLNAGRALLADQAGRPLTPTELGGLTRTYLRKCNTWLYAIQADEDGPVKIGKTVNPADRIKTLQTGNPTELRGLAAWRAMECEEEQLHCEFAYAHVRGEWFEPVPELLALVDVLGGDFEGWDA